MSVSKGLNIINWTGRKGLELTNYQKKSLFSHLVLKYECLGSIKTTWMVLSTCYKLVA